MAKKNNTNKLLLAGGVGLAAYLFTRKKEDTTTAENNPAPKTNTVPGKNGGDAPQTKDQPVAVTGYFLGATSTDIFFNPINYIGKTIYTGKPSTNIRTGAGLDKSIVATIPKAGTLVGKIRNGVYDRNNALWYEVEKTVWSSPVKIVYIRFDVASFSPTVDTNKDIMPPQQTQQQYQQMPSESNAPNNTNKTSTGKLLQWGLLGSIVVLAVKPGIIKDIQKKLK